MFSTHGALCRNTPQLTVTENRGLVIRNVRYHRHPDTLSLTDERITRHQYTARGGLVLRIDPRLFALRQADPGVEPNFVYISSLSGDVLRTVTVDAGTTITFGDAAGRPLLNVSATGLKRTFGYESNGLPGRLLDITEQAKSEIARVTERFFWADNSQAQRDRNLAGQCVRHYDTAGLNQTNSLALTGMPASVSRQLLQEHQHADWQGADELAWENLLAPTRFTTRNTLDATGAPLIGTDAYGNVQRLAYDIAGQLKGSWLTLKGQAEQVIVASVTYSAQGKKLREEHGNGVVTTYRYDAASQRLTGIKTERPAGHANGARTLQDLRYDYDSVGNVLLVHNDAHATRFWRNQKVVPHNTYLYDSLYQLIQAAGRQMASAGQQSSTLPSPYIPLPVDDSAYTHYTRTYTFDRGDNLNRIRHSAPATSNNYTTDITVSSRSNRAVLSSLAIAPDKVDELFDSAGHQLLLFAGQHLSWNARGELQQVNPVVREGAVSDSERYRYASDGLRVEKISLQLSGNSTQVQRVTYLPGLERRTTHSGDTLKEDLHTITVGEAGRAQVRVLHWEAGTVVSNDQVRYSYDDLIGSCGLEVDASGEILSEEEYYPFGGTSVWAARSQTEADYKTIRYSGRERDATGLYYYGHRYYQSWAGRWLSADPAGTVDGLNLYLMVRNNPVTFKDALGLILESENEAGADAPKVLGNLFKPEVFKVPFALIETLAAKLELTKDKPKQNILYISAKPNPFSIDMTEKATAEFASKKMSYLTHKGHQVTGAYVSSVQELTDTWNAIGTGQLAGIDKVILDYHGSISPRRGQQSVVIVGSTSELLDKDAIAKLQSKDSVKTVSLYTCFSGFMDKFNPAVGFLDKLTDADAHTVGFDAQGDNDMRSMKVNRHPQAGAPFDNALTALGITRPQVGRVKYVKRSSTEVEVQYQRGRDQVKTPVELGKYFS